MVVDGSTAIGVTDPLLQVTDPDSAVVVMTKESGPVYAMVEVLYAINSAMDSEAASRVCTFV